MINKMDLDANISIWLVKLGKKRADKVTLDEIYELSDMIYKEKCETKEDEPRSRIKEE
jgi:hypothetical protein